MGSDPITKLLNMDKYNQIGDSDVSNCVERFYLIIAVQEYIIVYKNKQPDIKCYNGTIFRVISLNRSP